jgi:xanthine/CO dehydrogenase XdhC/CoxF family maturation factor
MRELFDIFATRRRWPDEPMVLATVVRVEGSNFRRAGARLLVRASGACVGSVSGGCLEQDVLEHARELFAQPTGPRRLVYDTTVPDDRLFGTGAGCKGRVTLLLELLPPRREARFDDWLFKVEACLLEGAASIVASLVEGSAEGDLPRTIAVPCDEKPTRVLGVSLPNQAVACVQEGGRTVFIQRIEPQPVLLICGAGPTSRPLAAIAAQIGWRVKVLDWRKGLLAMAPFPDGTEVECVPSWAEYDFAAVECITAAVVMTHRWEEDSTAMRGLLQRKLVYLGLMGSHQRCAELLDTLGQKRLSDAASLNVDAPAGVPIGAEGPEEIAVSITARLIEAVRQNRRVVESCGDVIVARGSFGA